MISDAQKRLIILLAKSMRDEPQERERRWGVNSDFVAQYATEGRLLIARDWTADLVLRFNGEVLVIDTETGKPDERATEREARGALFRAISIYPELLSLLPERPAEAVECPSCAGTGVVEMSLEKPNLRNIGCYCSGAGWLLPSEAPGV